MIGRNIAMTAAAVLATSTAWAQPRTPGEATAQGDGLPPLPRLAPLTEPARDAPYGAASAIVPSPQP